MEYYHNLKVVHTPNHYDAVYLPEHHRAKKSSGMVYVHILQAEKMLGRFLSDEECVHHKDLNKTNNDISNLMVFATNADHTSYHHALNDHTDYELRYISGVYYCKILSKSTKTICPCCGKRKSQGAEFCFDCRQQKRRINLPDKRTLIQDLQHLSILAIGKKYGVSDNAVRKWLKIYNLPYKHSDITLFRQQKRR